MKKIKKRITDTPLPNKWGKICPEAIHRFDIHLAGHSVRMKLLIFRNVSSFNKFSRREFGKSEKNFGGLFVDLSYDVYGQRDGVSYHEHEVDPRFYGMMVLFEKNLNIEVIAHECCHAAMSFSRRLKGKWPDAHDPEEQICYPLGKLVAQVCSAVKSCGYTIEGNHGFTH